MNIIVTASNGHEIKTTKGNANCDLFRYIAADDARPKAVASGSLFDGPANDSK